MSQLNMVIKYVSWELFEEQFQGRYISKEFVECQLNDFNALQQGVCTVPEYEAHFWSDFGILHTHLLRNLMSTRSCLSLISTYMQRLGL
jgi:hypothetical protein